MEKEELYIKIKVCLMSINERKTIQASSDTCIAF